LIDDDDLVRAVVATRLKSLGCYYVEAGNGEEGLERYRQEKSAIDVVILDMSMPVMDGAECFEQLRKINPAVKVILSSGYSERDLVERVDSTLLSGHLHKPYEMDALKRVLNKVLNQG
ncbi:MAG: response regulator, partial [Zetaproteobacteria bacterium]|nr:response regulator [Zetaproteobacteria bacterium]